MGTDDLFKKRKAARSERSHEVRIPKPGSYLIVTEGEKTEPSYFKELARELVANFGSVIDVRVEGEGCSTVSLVEQASMIVSTSPRVYEHVWIVFDKDDFGDFDEAIDLAKSRGYEVAWSNQAFEYWLFLHFDYSDSALHRNDWKSKLNVIFKSRGVRKGGYKKNLDDLYQLVSKCGDEDLAIKSARSVHKRWQEKGMNPSGSDPCTTVYELVEQLRSYTEKD